MNRNQLHINCDLGEGSKNEAQIMNYIQACNIACGGHFGNSTSVYQTLSKAVDLGIEVGAHPSYPDFENFGRVSINLDKEAFFSSMRQQLDLYFDQLSKLKAENNHIKAHGALYNDLCVNEELCTWFLEIIKSYPHKTLYTPFNGSLADLAKESNRPVSFEAFIDRNYNREGRLVSRALANAEKDSLVAVYDQLESIRLKQEVQCTDGTLISMKADTFCIHGDHPLALERLQFIEERYYK